MINLVQLASVLFALGSAAAWYRAATVKITREQAVAQRTKVAVKNGETPNLSGVVLDGAELRETFAVQSKWNAVGAIGAAISVTLQSIAPFFVNGSGT